MNLRLGLVMRRLENSLLTQQFWGTLVELGKERAAKGEKWARPFISCVPDTVVVVDVLLF